MKSEAKILAAFILNLIFSLFEFIGGAFTGSVAIISDAIHDFGDAVSIGISYFLEKKSKKRADIMHTYGYARYSLLGCAITSLVLLLGSVIVAYNAVMRIINPVTINYNGMIVFAVVGVIINALAVLFTRGGASLNQKAVNIHMLEDVLSWSVVLVGALIMRFTDFSYLDPLMSIGVAVFVLCNALKSLRIVVDIFIEKTPESIDVKKLLNELNDVDGVLDIHHIHVRSFDGHVSSATMHVVTQEDVRVVKERVRCVLSENGIMHSTIECEGMDEICDNKICFIDVNNSVYNHLHHH